MKSTREKTSSTVTTKANPLKGKSRAVSRRTVLVGDSPKSVFDGELREISIDQANELFGITFTDRDVYAGQTAEVNSEPYPFAICRINDELGYGVFAVRDIAIGETLINYTGVRHKIGGVDLKKEFAGDRYVFKYNKQGLIITAKLFGNESRFIQHGPENIHDYDFLHYKSVALANIWREEGRDGNGFKAIHKIPRGRQLLYHYGDTYWNEINEIPQLFSLDGQPLDKGVYRPKSLIVKIRFSDGDQSCTAKLSEERLIRDKLDKKGFVYKIQGVGQPAYLCFLAEEWLQKTGNLFGKKPGNFRKWWSFKVATTLRTADSLTGSLDTLNAHFTERFNTIHTPDIKKTLQELDEAIYKPFLVLRDIVYGLFKTNLVLVFQTTLFELNIASFKIALLEALLDRKRKPNPKTLAASAAAACQPATSTSNSDLGTSGTSTSAASSATATSSAGSLLEESQNTRRYSFKPSVLLWRPKMDAKSGRLGKLESLRVSIMIKQRR